MGYPLKSPASEAPFFSFKAFSGPGVAHGFFGRRGGVSAGIYEGLNCGPGSGDEPARIAENRSRVTAAMGARELVSLYQEHGVCCVTAPFAGQPKADAMVTDQPGIALGILTADCVPALFYGRKADGQPVIAAAHAGWKGALGGALEAAVDKMISEFGADIDSIQGAIGPAIQKKSYEISAEFHENFLRGDEESERFFQSARKDGHFMFDLPGYCAMRLAQRGVKDVFVSDLDTYSAPDDFYSYRRATHRGEKDYGRQISAIVIS